MLTDPRSADPRPTCRRFVLEDGRRIRVLGDWNEGSAAATFLHDVRDGACRFFDGTLIRDYNAAHRDHVHLDRGRYRYCR